MNDKTSPDLDLILSQLDINSNALEEILSKKFNDYANDQNGFENFEKMAHLFEVPTSLAFCWYMGIKLCRLIELSKRSKSPSNESVEDTLLDLIGYATLYKAYLKKVTSGNN